MQDIDVYIQLSNGVVVRMGNPAVGEDGSPVLPPGATESSAEEFAEQSRRKFQ